MRFYIACVRSVIDYAAPVFHHGLPAYLSQELERVQKRAMRIICPGIEYQQALALMSLPTVAEHHHNICTRTFESIMSDPNHKLRKLLPPPYKSNYNLRHARTFTLPRCKTNRFKNSFFMASGRIVNNFQVSYYTFLVLAITIIAHFYNCQYKLLSLCKYAIQLMLQCIK